MGTEPAATVRSRIAVPDVGPGRIRVSNGERTEIHGPALHVRPTARRTLTRADEDWAGPDVRATGRVSAALAAGSSTVLIGRLGTGTRYEPGEQVSAALLLRMHLEVGRGHLDVSVAVLLVLAARDARAPTGVLRARPGLLFAAVGGKVRLIVDNQRRVLALAPTVHSRLLFGRCGGTMAASCR